MGVDVEALLFLEITGPQRDQHAQHLQDHEGAHPHPQEGETGSLQLNHKLSRVSSQQTIRTGGIHRPEGQQAREQDAEQARHTVHRQHIEAVIKA